MHTKYQAVLSLVAAGSAVVNLQDRHGCSALHYAACFDVEAKVRFSLLFTDHPYSGSHHPKFRVFSLGLLIRG